MTFELDAPLASDSWTAPERVEVRGDWLMYPAGGQWRVVSPARGLLEGFIRLHDARDERIARFAERWGPLWVCDEHMLPVRHAAGDGHSSSCFGLQVDGVPATPLATWRFWSRQALALLRLGVSLRGGKPGQRQEWEAISDEALSSWRAQMGRLQPFSPLRLDEEGRLYRTLPTYGASLTGSTAEFRERARGGAQARFGGGLAHHMERQELAHAIRTWIAWGLVTPRFRWISTQPEVVLSTAGLFGAIGVQIMMAVSRSDGLVLCSACGQPYVPRRRPIAAQRHYCEDCRSMGAPVRDAAAAYRARRKKEGRDGQARER